MNWVARSPNDTSEFRAVDQRGLRCRTTEAIGRLLTEDNLEVIDKPIDELDHHRTSVAGKLEASLIPALSQIVQTGGSVGPLESSQHPR